VRLLSSSMVTLPPLTPAAIALLVGNLLDGLVTLTLLQLGLVREINPLLECAYEVSPLAFMVGKLSMVQLSILIAALQYRPRVWQVFSASGALLYVGVVVYQLVLIGSLRG
jgi:hypothetical protein